LVAKLPSPDLIIKNYSPTLTKITWCPEVRAAPNAIYFKGFYRFVLYNSAARLHTEDTMSKASPGGEPVAHHNFACLKTVAFVPDCTKPIRNSGSRALASSPNICTPGTWMLYIQTSIRQQNRKDVIELAMDC
jgi:hypothetical protein